MAAAGRGRYHPGDTTPGRFMSRSLAKSTTVVGSMTLTSRIMGFLRDIVFARFFGAGAGMDVFVVAFQIPNFLRRLFGEGAFSQAFVPVLSEYHSQRPHQDVQDLADRVSATPPSSAPGRPPTSRRGPPRARRCPGSASRIPGRYCAPR